MARFIPIDPNATEEEKKRYYETLERNHMIQGIGLIIISTFVAITSLLVVLIR
jgi:hypothetical protein